MSRDEYVRSELRALLTRAADAECSRQRAVRDRDHSRQAALEHELAALWQRHAELEAKSSQ